MQNMGKELYSDAVKELIGRQFDNIVNKFLLVL
jgi:hypothetical protein